MFERHRQPLISRRRFIRRLSLHSLIAAVFISFSLAIGIFGYHELEGMDWVDSFLNSAMLMGGMGPVGDLHSRAGKVFAGIYALYCGIVFILSMSYILAPVLHRFLHQFHLEEAEGDHDPSPPRTGERPRS